jgi:hypothetical protein
METINIFFNIFKNIKMKNFYKTNIFWIYLINKNIELILNIFKNCQLICTTNIE